ncbi:MAG: hypothetical protein PVF13_04005 [Chromatiales bacterium]
MSVDDLLYELELNPPEGLSLVRRRQRDKAIILLSDEALLDAAYSINNLSLEGEVGGDGLYVGGEILPTPPRLPKKGELTALGCGACTLGSQLDVRVRELFAEKRAPLALALDSLGNELMLVLGRHMQFDLLANVRRQGLILGQQLQFGESELDLSTRAAVLRLSGATKIGIKLHRGNLLRPQKSIAAVYAVGRNLPKLSLSRYRRG